MPSDQLYKINRLVKQKKKPLNLAVFALTQSDILSISYKRTRAKQTAAGTSFHNAREFSGKISSITMEGGINIWYLHYAIFSKVLYFPFSFKSHPSMKKLQESPMQKVVEGLSRYLNAITKSLFCLSRRHHCIVSVSSRY